MITGIIAGAALAFSLTVPVHAATAAPGKGPGPRGETASGQIRDTANPAFCITAPNGAEAGDPLFIASCVKGDAFQLWHCAKFEGLGECSLVATRNPLDIGQQGPTSNVRVIDPDKGANYFLAYLQPHPGSFILSNQSYRGWYLAMPRKPLFHRVYQIHWAKPGTAPKALSYFLTFPEWKPNPA